eukprot:1076928-Pyramimonas_sp.AAC.1
MLLSPDSRSVGISIGTVRHDGRPRDKRFHRTTEAPSLSRAGVWRPCVRSFIANRNAIVYVAFFMQRWQSSTSPTKMACLQCPPEARGASYWDVECATDVVDPDYVSQYVSTHCQPHAYRTCSYHVPVRRAHTGVDFWKRTSPSYMWNGRVYDVCVRQGGHCFIQISSNQVAAGWIRDG